MHHPQNMSLMFLSPTLQAMQQTDRTIYVGSVGKEVDEAALLALFGHCGTVGHACAGLCICHGGEYCRFLGTAAGVGFGVPCWPPAQPAELCRPWLSTVALPLPAKMLCQLSLTSSCRAAPS